MSQPKLYYFTEDEFIRNGENWFDKTSPRLLVLLDAFRHLTGKCIISPHPKAIGRRDGLSDSQHNYDFYAEVRAVDLFPALFPYVSIYNQRPNEWIETATEIGFTGIGFYPNWTYKGEQRPGLHLDVRESNKPGEPVTWGRIGEQYVSIDQAMEVLV